MSETSLVEIGLACLGVLFAIIGYLLSKKDEKQEKYIEELFKMHNKDAADLADLKLKLAEHHPSKADIEATNAKMEHRLEKLESTMDRGFSELTSRMDLLLRELHEHIITEQRNK